MPRCSAARTASRASTPSCWRATSAPATSPANRTLGQYADITKQADLYFDQGPFAFPVTLTDTPGTNDPFLIRDEITRRSLESADLYIVVLTARQPLSEADVNLMRLMHGLNSERIIVFVNRVDDFADVGYDLAEVLMYVEKKLEANFPGARIPIVAGSAAWANGALKGDDETLQPADAAFLARLPLRRSASCSRTIWSPMR